MLLNSTNTCLNFLKKKPECGAWDVPFLLKDTKIVLLTISTMSDDACIVISQTIAM